ncbi:MAG: YraN family protein [Clostridia bacterium]|nr:YraN family protein [Clostridia bacterium]MBQ6894036.1 YraN family protein [Clostridia bacterium]
MNMYKKLVGNMGEDIATNYLKKKKYKILDKNFTAGKGEIDIIALKDKTTVFIEVKTRQNEDFGTPAEAVDLKKRKKLIETATRYINEKNPDTGFRFDVIEVYGCLKDGEFYFEKIEHIEDAFGVNY